MKTLMALVLSLGMVLLGTAPVMAAGQAMQAAAPLQQSEIVQVVVPEGKEVADEDLEKTNGEFLVGAVVGGLVNGIGSAIEWAAGAAAGSYLAQGKVNWKAVGYAAAAGFAGGFVRGAIKGAIVGP